MDEDYNITEDNGDKKINIKTNLKEIFTLNPKPDRTFKYTNSVNKLLSYIYNNVYNELLEKQYNFVANGESNFHSQLWFMPTSMKNASKNKKNDEVKEKEDSAIVGPMLKNLGLAIINHRNFINFNVCVVHSGKEREKNEIISTFDQENHRKIYFQCIQSSNVKNCIKDIENKSKEANKSLIILTGQRLRLGITLPCVDIAIHMDNIKSYDIIYQSMFRVLTERPGKTRGYFVDMILDRAIQFFYKYTRNNKKITSIEKITKEDVRKNLLLFDVGSISQSFGFTTIDQPVNSYSEIAENFRIDKDEKFEQYKAEILKNKSDEDNDLCEIKVTTRPIKLHITTYGGTVYDVFTAIDTIKNMKVDVHTICKGIVASAGTLLSLAGKKRYITENSYMLIHEVRSGMWGKFSDLKEEYDNVTELM